MYANESRVGRVKGYRACAELVPDTIVLIFNRLTLEEKVQIIPRVCKAWRLAAEEPYSWQKIDIDGWITKDKHKKLDRMLRMLVTRSAGCFRELYVSRIFDPHLSFISHHARSLRVLSVKSSFITDSMVEQVAPQLSSLTAIDLSHCDGITARSLAAIGTNCGSLESLTWDVDRTQWCPNCGLIDFAPDHNPCGQAIARTMPNLKRLSIAYVNIDTEVAHEILSGCPGIQWFNVKGCLLTNFKGSLLKDNYPNIEVVDDHQDPGDDDDEWVGCSLCGFGNIRNIS